MPEKKRPNILCIISDDTDLSYLSCYGGNVLTPAIQSIADAGAVFNSHYCSSSVCTPSRYSYLTGRYASACTSEPFRKRFPEGSMTNIQWNVHIQEKNENLGGMLQQAGYRTGYVGKMHSGLEEEHLGLAYENDTDKRAAMPVDADPYDPAFQKELQRDQEIMIAEMNRIGFEYAARLYWNNCDKVPAERMHIHNTEWIAEGALAFLESQKDDERPFFLTMATTVIHGPDHRDSIEGDPLITRAGVLEEPAGGMPPRDTIKKRLREAGIPYDHNAAGALWLDDAVGAVLRKAEELGLLENTIVVYKSDHNARAKSSCLQEGVHIPMVMSWPGVITPGSQVDALTQNIDFLPTMLEAAGVEQPTDVRIDGISLLPLLRGEKEKIHDDLYLEIGTQRGVMTKRYKYIVNRYTDEAIEFMKSDRAEVPTDLMSRIPGNFFLGLSLWPHYLDPEQLYDLEKDPLEQNNLAGDPAYGEVVESLKARLGAYLESFDHPYPLEGQPFLETERYRQLVQTAYKKAQLPLWWMKEKQPR
jgi:arylsulfatase A-like enzyme